MSQIVPISSKRSGLMRQLINRLNTKAKLISSSAHFHDGMTPQELVDDSIALLLDALDRFEGEAIKAALDASLKDEPDTVRVDRKAMHDLGKVLDYMRENIKMPFDGHQAIEQATSLFKQMSETEL